MFNIKKIIKEEIDDFQWMRDIPAYTPMPTDEDEYINLEYSLMDKTLDGLRYNGWELNIDTHSGVVEWFKPDENILIFATPHFDEQGYVPVDVSDLDGDGYDSIGHIPIPRFDYVETTIDWYRNEYPKKVLNLVIEDE